MSSRALAPAIGMCYMMKMDRRNIARQVRQAAPPDRPSMVTSRVANRILIVDDNADLADAISTVLDDLWIDTTTAYSGRHALEKTRREFRPEVVLLDIGLPDMDGYEVAATIRKDCGLERPSSLRCRPTNSTPPRRRWRKPGSTASCSSRSISIFCSRFSPGRATGAIPLDLTPGRRPS